MADFLVTYSLDVFDVSDEREAAQQAAETLMRGDYTAARSVYDVRRSGSRSGWTIDLSGENPDVRFASDAADTALRRISARMHKVWATFEPGDQESRHGGIDVDALVVQLDAIEAILARAGISRDPGTGRVKP